MQPTKKESEVSILKGKTAVVTGSTSGIGLGCARAFAGAGANIVLNGIEAPADVEKARTAIENDFGVNAIYSPADMAEPMEIASMISLTEKTFGRADVLVNNAGIQHVSPIEDFPVEKWDAVIAINLSSAFHAFRAVTPGMKQRGWGRIINTASAHSLVASPFKSAYVAAKHGIAGLTKTVALELAQSRITCNCISPGYVWTPLGEKQIPETMKARPQPRCFMPGVTARIAWNAEERLIAMTASHFSTGKSSIGETCWMPALLTSTSTLPNVLSANEIMLAISVGSLIFAGE